MAGPVSSRLGVGVAAAFPVLLAAWVYFPITRSYFWSDDFTNMVSIVNDGFLSFVLRPFGGHNLLVRNLAFYGSYQLFGLRADLYFWTVLLTFLLAVWLLFRVLRNLTGSLTLACFGAALWGTSPVNDGTLAWYSVYGQVLAATILLLVLDRVTALARTGGALTTRTACAWYALLLLGTGCFGVGVGVALAFPAVLFLVLPDAWRRPRIRVAYLALPLVTIAMYVAFRRLYPLVGALPPEEAFMATGLPPLAELVPMLRELLVYSVASSLRSFAAYSRRAHPLPGAWITLAVFGVGVLVLLWRGDATTRRAAAAMAVLWVAIYLVIAIGRASLVGLAGSLAAAAAQRRYHFVGAIPVVIVACLALQQIGRLGPLRRVPRGALLLAALVLGGWTYRRSAFVVNDNARARAEFQAAVRAIDTAVAAQPPGATVYIDTGPRTTGLLGFVMPKRDFPGRAGVFLLMQPGDEMEGRRVRFVERDPAVRTWYASRPETRLGRLLVDANAAPALR